MKKDKQLKQSCEEIQWRTRYGLLSKGQCSELSSSTQWKTVKTFVARENKLGLPHEQVLILG